MAGSLFQRKLDRPGGAEASQDAMMYKRLFFDGLYTAAEGPRDSLWRAAGWPPKARAGRGDDGEGSSQGNVAGRRSVRAAITKR